MREFRFMSQVQTDSRSCELNVSNTAIGLAGKDLRNGHYVWCSGSDFTEQYPGFHECPRICQFQETWASVGFDAHSTLRIL